MVVPPAKPTDDFIWEIPLRERYPLDLLPLYGEYLKVYGGVVVSLDCKFTVVDVARKNEEWTPLTHPKSLGSIPLKHDLEDVILARDFDMQVVVIQS